jgi:SSS family solute:Na+ symporter
MSMSFNGLDWLVVSLYFLALGAIAWWVVRKKPQSSEDYFLAGRHVGWFVIGASIFASNIGSEHIVGLAGTGAKTGLVMGHYELHSWLVLTLGWVFVPFYMRSQVFTMPEFLERRYNGAARWILSLSALIAYVLTKISVTIYAGAVVFQVLMGIDFWTGALAVVILTGVYTVLGGLRAVVYTEALQAMVLLAGSAIVTFTGLARLGGWEKLLSLAGPEQLNMFLPADHPDFPWTGMLFAPPIVGLWYWCTDQYIVQRVLAARDETQARRGTIFAAYLKLTPFFIFLLTGVIAAALAKSGQLQLSEADQAFPAMVAALLPAGVRGLVAGGLLAALMSSLAAVFNSSSTLFTMDIYKKLHPQASERTLVVVGKIATTVLVATGIAWIPFLRSLSGELYHYLQSVQAYIAPPIAAVFLLGLFSKRINGTGAVTALAGGFLLGMARLVAEINKDALGGWLLYFAEINFLHFCIFLFLACVAILVAVSLATKPPSEEQIRGLTYETTVSADRASSRASWTMSDVLHSAIVVAVVLAVLLYFSPLRAYVP